MQKFFAFLLLTLTMSSLSWAAEDLSLTSYYPTPSGHYDQIQLYPQNALPSPTPSCYIGTLYNNLTDFGRLWYCTPVDPNNLSKHGLYVPIPGVWTIVNKKIFLTDFKDPLKKSVIIGSKDPTFKLTLENDGAILATGKLGEGTQFTTKGAGTKLIWYPRTGAFRAGYVNGNQWDERQMGHYSVALGNSNTASTTHSIVLGGKDNEVTTWDSGIVGGQENTVNGFGTIAGGYQNSGGDYIAGYQNKGSGGTIYGGRNNINTTDRTTIGGGASNRTDAYLTIIGGGQGHQIKFTPKPAANTIGGILGGKDNAGPNAHEPYYTIGGGLGNKVSVPDAVLLGELLAIGSGVGGGNMNQGGAGGGENNKGPVAGGSSNDNRQGLTPNTGITNPFSLYGVIGGGLQNMTRGTGATVGGGFKNVVLDDYSIIPGGGENRIEGDDSFAAGRNMHLKATAISSPDHTFVWGYANAPVQITKSDAFIIYSGRVGINETDPSAVLEINGRGSATDDYLAASWNHKTPGSIFIVKANGWVGVGRNNPQHPLHFGTKGGNAYVDTGGFFQASSRDYKENIENLTIAAAKQTLKDLNPVTFHYTKIPDKLRVGFIAEDVPNLLAIKDRSSVNPLEVVSVLTKVIQEQEQKLQEQKIVQDSLLEEIKNLSTKVRNHVQP